MVACAVASHRHAMSVDLNVYLARSSMPSPTRWAQAIREAGFPADEERVDLGVPADHDFSVTFATHSSMRELATSVIAAAVLCQLSGGRLSDPQAGEDVAAEDALTWARSMLTEIAADLDE